MKITDELLAWDLDNAVALRLQEYDIAVAKHQAKMVAMYATRAFNGESLDDDEPQGGTEFEVW